MKLSEVEKVILHNQFEILRKINPGQEAEYDLILKCLYSGYDDDLEDLLPQFDTPLDPLVREEVRERYSKCSER